MIDTNTCRRAVSDFSYEGAIHFVDLQPILSSPENAKAIKLEPITQVINGLPARKSWGEAHYVLPIPRTDRFLCLTRASSGYTARVYELSPEGIMGIERWSCSDVPAIVHDGKVWTFAANPDRLEVRSQEDFRLLSSLPIPDELKTELAKWSDVRHHNDLISFPGVQALAPLAYRLDDLSKVAGVNLPVVFYGSEKDTDARYHLLANDLPGNHQRIAVYDSHSRKLAYDARPPLGLVASGIVDGQLVMVTEAMGLTVDLVDLATGQHYVRHQPFRWYVWATPAICLLALVWFVMWSRYSTAWLHPLPNIVLVALLFLTPLVWRVLTIHYWNILWRPAVGYSLAALFAMAFAFAVLAALGTQRILLRLTGLCLWLSCVGWALRGLHNMDWQDSAGGEISVSSMLFNVSTVTVLVACLLFALRRCGLIPPLSAIARSPEDRARKAAIPMRDLFALTGGVALLFSAMTFSYAHLREHWLEIGGILVLSSPGLLALVRNQRVLRVAAVIHIALACVVIVLATFGLAWGNCIWILWFRQVCDLSCFLLVTVGSFGLCC